MSSRSRSAQEPNRLMRVSDCVAAAELLRKRARVYERLRCSALTCFRTGDGPDEIPWRVQASIMEELLISANQATQEADALMARLVLGRPK